MSNIVAIWAGMAARTRILAISGLLIPLVLIVAVTASVLGSVPPSADPVRRVPVASGPVGVVPTVTPAPRATLAPLPPVATPDPSAPPVPTPTPPPPGADPLLGTDGRLTVLLLGSDYRPAHPGNRTDAIMVVSVDPTTGKTAAFSVPRDTVGFPLPGKGTYGAKVNGLYQYLESRTRDGGQAMKSAVSRAFDLEVDRYVFIGFAGVKQLVRAVGGVDVTLEKAYHDPYYWVNPGLRGWGLPRGTSHLGPDDALIFARSRKGDNDFERARRQQLLVMAAFDKVRARGIGSIGRLLRIARTTVRTDLPLDRAKDLYKLFSTTDISKARRSVFGPRSYATDAGGSSFTLRLDVCREWIAKNFPAVRPMGQWPDAPAVEG